MAEYALECQAFGSADPIDGEHAGDGAWHRAGSQQANVGGGVGSACRAILSYRHTTACVMATGIGRRKALPIVHFPFEG